MVTCLLDSIVTQYLDSILFTYQGVSALEDAQRQRSENLWEFETPLRVKIQLATFITVTEAGQVCLIYT